MQPKYDILWKGMIEEVMEDLLLFVEPRIGRDLDLKRGFVYLDKELAALDPQPDQPANTKVVDKLVKVFLRDGSEQWMLLHLEVQGTRNNNFSRHMFDYFIRIFAKYGQPVAAIALLTAKDGRKMPAAYEDQCLWMRAGYEYKTICIEDYPDEVLAASKNPFAVVLLVAKETLLRVGGTKEARDSVLLDQKLQIVRLLKKRMAVFGAKKTRAILSFLNNYVVFEESETNLNFMEQIDQIFGKKNTMGVIEQLAELKHQEGIEMGKQVGIKEGLEIAVQNLLVNTKLSPSEISVAVGVPVDLVDKVKLKMNTK